MLSKMRLSLIILASFSFCYAIPLFNSVEEMMKWMANRLASVSKLPLELRLLSYMSARSASASVMRVLTQQLHVQEETISLFLGMAELRIECFGLLNTWDSIQQLLSLFRYFEIANTACTSRFWESILLNVARLQVASATAKIPRECRNSIIALHSTIPAAVWPRLLKRLVDKPTFHNSPLPPADAATTWATLAPARTNVDCDALIQALLALPNSSHPSLVTPLGLFAPDGALAGLFPIVVDIVSACYGKMVLSGPAVHVNTSEHLFVQHRDFAHSDLQVVVCRREGYPLTLNNKPLAVAAHPCIPTTPAWIRTVTLHLLPCRIGYLVLNLPVCDSAFFRELVEGVCTVKRALQLQPLQILVISSQLFKIYDSAVLAECCYPESFVVARPGIGCDSLVGRLASWDNLLIADRLFYQCASCVPTDAPCPGSLYALFRPYPHWLDEYLTFFQDTATHPPHWSPHWFHGLHEEDLERRQDSGSDQDSI